MSNPFLRFLTRITVITILAAVVGGGSPPVAAQTSNYIEPANLADLIAAAAKDGSITLAAGDVYGSAPGAKMLQDHLNSKYHVHLTIDYRPVPSGAAFVIQLGQEAKAGHVASSDLAFSLFNAVAAPYMQRIDWRKYMPSLPASDMFYDMHSVGVYTTLGAIDYNPTLVPKDQVPQSFADLLKPQWKGKIATSPYQGNFLAYIGLPEVFGHQAMLDYVKKFSAQVGGIMTCGGIDRVPSGEFAMFGIDCGEYEVRRRQSRNVPIAETFMREGVPLVYMAPSIPLTSAHPNAARLFIVYLLSPEGQRDLWDLMSCDDDQLPGSQMAKMINGLKKRGVKIVPVYGREVKQPELLEYADEINKIVNSGR